MTREEIIQAISDDKIMPFIQPEQLAQIVEFVIKNYRSPLPEDLDEAAWVYVKKKYRIGEPEKVFENEEIVEDFKAGAKWMTEQGETIFDTIDVDGGERWLSENLLQGDYDCGEEVIVQIRKK